MKLNELTLKKAIELIDKKERKEFLRKIGYKC